MIRGFCLCAVVAFALRMGVAGQISSVNRQPPTAELVESCLVSKSDAISCRFALSGIAAIDSVKKAVIRPPAQDDAACPWLPDSGPKSNTDVAVQDASSISSLLGSPYPYAAVAQGSTILLIYRVSSKPAPGDEAALLRLNREIFSLYYNVPRTAAPKAFTVNFQVPHAAALGDLATRLQSLNYANLTAQDVGGDMVRVTSSSGTPDCKTWAAFVDELHRAIWSVHPESPVAWVFFHAATDVSNALAGTNAPGTTTTVSATGPSNTAGTGGSSTSAAATPGSSGTGSGGTGGTGTGGAPSTPTGGTASTSASSTGTGSATVSISQPAGTTTTLNMVTAGTATPGNGLPSSATGPAPTSGSIPGAAAGSSSGAAAVKPSVSEASIGPDAVIFTDSTTGDDSLITEKKRLIAGFDLLRPEMLINTWILQESTNDPKNSGRLLEDVRKTVNEHNDGIQNAITKGSEYLRWRMMIPVRFFNMDFYNYVVPRVVFDASSYASQPSSLTAGDIVTRTLRDQDVPRTLGRAGVSVDITQYGDPSVLGFCAFDRYCLGYTTFFQPLRPSLTTMIMAFIAARHPGSEANCAIDYVEDLPDPTPPCASPFERARVGVNRPLPLQRVCDSNDQMRQHCQIVQAVAKAERLDINFDHLLVAAQLQAHESCETADEHGTIWSMNKYTGPPIFFMECLRRIVNKMDPDADNPDDAQASSFGIARAAVADFLFHYKMSQQYPHEFNPYDLTQSAQNMNSALRPLIQAFNQDLTAYQQVIQSWFQATTNSSESYSKDWYGLGKNHFTYNALVTVQTISRSEATIDTTTESYLDTLSTPTVSALLSGINSALPSSSGGGGGSGNGATTTTTTSTTNGNSTTTSSTTSPVVPTAKPTEPVGVLSNLSLNQAQVLVGALGALQSSHVHIGREIYVDVVPESLSGSSSAELQITLHADDSSNPPTFTVGGPAGATDPEISRFSKSETSTRIRVDSVRMFEVTSFSAVLDTSRKNFPIVPPFVQLPYIGSILSWPGKPGKEYHSNIAVMSAVVIPTATDLALGIRFVADRLIEPPPLEQSIGCYWPPVGSAGAVPAYPRPCNLRPTISLSDFAGQSVREYHRKMIQCLATKMHGTDPNSFPADHLAGANFCGNLTYSEVPVDAN
jgi:hypothetical protein